MVLATTNVVINGVTIYATEIKHYFRKNLINILPATSSGNWVAGVKPTKVVDLLRMEERFQITGFIDASAEAQLYLALTQGGVVAFSYAGPYYSVSTTVAVDALDTMLNPKTDGEQDELAIVLTCIVGVNI